MPATLESGGSAQSIRAPHLHGHRLPSLYRKLRLQAHVIRRITAADTLGCIQTAPLTCSKYPTGGSGGVKPPGGDFNLSGSGNGKPMHCTCRRQPTCMQPV